MSVPPSGQRPSSTPPSKKSTPSDDDKEQKAFQLPGRKEQVKAQEEEKKKKGLFDLSSDEIGIKAKQQGIQQEVQTDLSAGIEKAAADKTAAVTQVSQVAQLIQKTVESMRIGQVGGKDFASLELKTNENVPQAFAGAHLTVSYEANQITIHFDHFMTPQQENTAINLVEKNKEQLVQMMQSLNAKNIQIAELSLGSHVVALPRIEGLPPPFQPTLTAETEPSRQQDQGDQGREQNQGEPE